MNPIIPRSLGTHNGTFHADEVTACALLLLFNLIDEDKIIRTRDPILLSSCEFVCDVGGTYDPEKKLFDHHQHEYTGDLSSAGMVLLYLKQSETLDQHLYDFFNSSLIIGVDLHDNGRDMPVIGRCTYSLVISNFTPIYHTVKPEEQDIAFFEALHFAFSHLKRLWKRYQYMHSCRDIVKQAMLEKKEYLLFNQSIPWMDAFFELDGLNHPAKFVIMPSGNQWKLRGIPPSLDKKMTVRLPLPQEWAGLLENELKQASGIPGAVFCHKGRFISVWDTYEDAFKALLYIQQNTKK